MREAVANGAKPPQIFYIGGQIVDMRTIIDRKNQKMAFVKIEDFNNIYEVVVFGSVYPQLEPELKINNVICLKGRLNSDLDENMVKFKAENIWPLQRLPEVMTKALVIKVDPSTLNDDLIYKLKLSLTGTTGESRLFFEIPSENGKPYRLISNKIKIQVTRNVLSQLEKSIGLDNIKVEVKEL